MQQEDGTYKHMPILSQQTYHMMKGSGSKQDKIDKINDAIKDTGYVVDKNKTNKAIIYYKNDKDKKAVIAHRGTVVTHPEDIVSDASLSVGADSKGLEKRRKRTEKLFKQTPEDYDIHMTGHSLGGHTAVDSALRSKHVRNRVKGIHTFNGAFAPFNKVGKKKIKDLDDKVVHHRINGDLVSSVHKISPSIGAVKTYKPKEKNKYKYKYVPKHLQKTFNNLDQLNLHTISNFVP